MTAADVCAAIRRYRFTYQDEAELQRALSEVLEAAGLPAEPEVRLGPRDRIDFMVGRVGVEVKVAGEPDAVARQLGRYAESGRVDELVLVTSRVRHLLLPQTVGGKPLHVVSLLAL